MGLAVGLSALGTGLAQARIGAAGLGSSGGKAGIAGSGPYLLTAARDPGDLWIGRGVHPARAAVMSKLEEILQAEVEAEINSILAEADSRASEIVSQAESRLRPSWQPIGEDRGDRSRRQPAGPKCVRTQRRQCTPTGQRGSDGPAPPEGAARPGKDSPPKGITVRFSRRWPKRLCGS